VRGLFFCDTLKQMDLLHATIEEFAAEGYVNVECFRADLDGTHAPSDLRETSLC